MIQLDMLAREFDLAMVVVRHFRKSDADDPPIAGSVYSHCSACLHF
jgi:hypothetical protein